MDSHDQSTEPRFVFYTSPDVAHISSSTSTPQSRIGQRTKILLILLSLFFVVLIGGGLFAYAYAYNYITFGSPADQQKLSFFIQSLPFTPKTPSYVIVKTLQAHSSVKNARFDAVLTVSVPGSNMLFFGSTFNFRYKGYSDYSNPLKPSFDINMQGLSDFDVDLKLHESQLYFRINKIPSYFSEFFSLYSTLLGMHSPFVDSFINRWFFIPYPPDNTDQSALPTQQSAQTDLHDSFVDMITLINQADAKKHITMELITQDNSPVYHIRFRPSAEALDSYWFWHNVLRLQDLPQQDQLSGTFENNKLSTIFKNLTFTVWIDKTTYLLKKALISADIHLQSFFSSSSMLSFPSETLPVSFSLTLSDYGKKIPIDIPHDAVDFESYARQLFQREATSSAFFR